MLEVMITLCIRYTLNPNKLPAFRKYAEDEVPVITRSGGKVAGYYLPTDFAGPVSQAMGLVDFQSLAEYEQYRSKLANDPEHQTNITRLEESGVLISMDRSIIRRIDYA